MTHDPDHDNHDDPAAVQPVRGAGGRFAKGNPARVGRPFTPGQSGNPTGRRGGATVGDWLRQMASNFTEAELQGIAADEDAPAGQRGAARLVLDVLADDPDTRRRAVNQIVDRTEGRPSVQVSVTPWHTPDPSESMDRLVALIERRPDLLGEVLDRAPSVRAMLLARLGAGSGILGEGVEAPQTPGAGGG